MKTVVVLFHTGFLALESTPYTMFVEPTEAKIAVADDLKTGLDHHWFSNQCKPHDCPGAFFRLDLASIDPRMIMAEPYASSLDRA